MSAEVMHHQPIPAEFDPAAAGSLFSCSRSDIPCHHFCLRHSKPLRMEVEEWFMTDEVEVEEDRDEEGRQEEARRSQEEARRGQEDESELMQTGLLDQLLDEAYSHYYEEPDEWDELANWYTTRMNRDEQGDVGHQSNQSSSGAAQQEDFHPAWRQEAAGTPGRFARGSEIGGQNQPPVGTPPGRFAAAAPGTTTSREEQRRSSEPDPAGHRRSHVPKQRDWAEQVDEQEQEEEFSAPGNSHRHRRGSAGWGEPSLVRELELYDTFNDLFFPDPESGRL